MTPRRSLLFDLDGTMVDTDVLHINAYNMLLEPQGKYIDLDYYRRFIMGFGVDDIMSGLLPDHDRATHLQLAGGEGTPIQGPAHRAHANGRP